MANDLLIKINADAANAKKEFDDIRDKTTDLESALTKSALVAGVAFAAFTAEIGFSVKAFAEANQASVQLSNALQNQGIYTEALKNQYGEFADVVQAKTGIDNDAITKAQAVAQTYLGQTKITQELTTAIADLGAEMGGDLNGAAEKIARTIGTGTNAFARQGLVISESANENERFAKVLEFVQAKAGGLAEEFNKADGYTKALDTSFGNLQEAIGSRFFPVVAALRQAFITMFDYISSNPILTDLAVAAIAAGVAVTGLITALALGVPAFLALSAAAAAFGVASNIALAGIPAAIGLIVAGITLLALNWDKSLAFMKAAAVGAVTLISELFSGLGQVLKGAFSLDPATITAGLSTISGAFKKAKDEATSTYAEIRATQQVEGEKQNAQKLALANKEAALERQHQANLAAIRAAGIELLRLQNEGASQALIDIKSKELEVLKALDAQKSAAEIEQLKIRLGLLQATEMQIKDQDLQESLAFETEKQAAINELQAEGYNLQYDLSVVQQDKLRETILTDKDLEQKVIEEKLKARIDGYNRQLEETRKYGASYALISKALQSDEVKGAKSASSDLVALQESKNATLKEIGKAAAIAQITIGTAEAAMNIYRGFATIPIVGPALGIAGAAAAIAFGAERIGQVTSAANGGLIEGGVQGKDSVPALLMPGELVVPKKNFNDVVNSVGGGGTGGGNSDAMLSALQSIDTKFSNPQQITFQGDILADDSYINLLLRKLSDALEFRNGTLYGVNT